MDEESEEFKQALENKNEVWEGYFAEIPEELRDIPLSYKIMRDPYHPISQLCLYLYTLDTWLFQELNKGSREGDTAKIDTLGPYAAALKQIVIGAAKRRTDIPELKNKLEVEGCELFRAGGFKKEKIEQFKQYVHKKEVRYVIVKDPETGEELDDLEE